jgi:hypothetical protein
MSDIESRLTPPLQDLATVTMKRAREVRRSGILLSSWEHVIEEGTDWRAALERQYWLNCADKLRAGDTVIVHSSDHFIQFQMLVLDVNSASAPAYLNIAFRPIYPPDLDLPAPPLQVSPRYGIRQAPSSSNFRVIDMETGLPVHLGEKERRDALEYAAELERGLAATGEQVARAFARHLDERAATERDAVTEDDVTPGARRMRRLRERQRAGEAAQ